MRAHSVVYACFGFVAVPRFTIYKMDVARSLFVPICKTRCSMKKLNFFREELALMRDPKYRKTTLRDIAIIIVSSFVIGLIGYLCSIIRIQQDYIDEVDEYIRKVESKY